MGNPDNPTPITFSRSLFTEEVLVELVESVVNAQATYGARAEEIAAKLDRYQQLLVQAMSEAGTTLTPETEGLAATRPPSFVLLPYFAASSLSDPWWDANRRIWQLGVKFSEQSPSAVVAVGNAATLREAIQTVPTTLSEAIFFWITGLDERRASDSELLALANAVLNRPANRQLINLYGGFFSICLEYVGLWGFNNGLGYSESRSWPELSATGAAPARYYVRRLHAFFAPAVAQLLADADPTLRCDCVTCVNRNVVGLTYHELKRHFALSRRWEIHEVRTNMPEDIAATLDDTAQRMETVVAGSIPLRLVPDARYLRTWARVLRQFPTAQ
jgi:hypothetical protein